MKLSEEYFAKSSYRQRNTTIEEQPKEEALIQNAPHLTKCSNNSVRLSSSITVNVAKTRHRY